mmetsp:Transcript_29124/g.53137  ORF Transcript_29124/g.53137 Transcript_29124/m.53137 type:complete len:358 (+) Transcript_29124:77-1150(+)
MNILGSLCKAEAGRVGPVLQSFPLSFPFECESPFLFAVYHLDHYPPGNDELGPAASLAGHNIGADFGHRSGWNMYHGGRVPGFPKHPHRGFETITVTTRGWIDHTDSLGNAGRFGGGDVQWMTAGRGISHAEMFPLLNKTADNPLELFQIWINLPKRTKMVPPSFKMLWREDMVAEDPPGATGDVKVTLIAGSIPGMKSPPSPPPDSYATDPASDVMVLTLQVAKGATWTLPAYDGKSPVAGLNRNLYLYADTGAVIDGKKVPGKRRLKLQPDVSVTISAGDAPVEALLLQGRDIGEPVVQQGPFVVSTREEVMQAMRDYQTTGFGGWPWKSDSVTHPREKQRFAKYADGKLEERDM